jgi:hypothetical protein
MMLVRQSTTVPNTSNSRALTEVATQELSFSQHKRSMRANEIRRELRIEARAESCD